MRIAKYVTMEVRAVIISHGYDVFFNRPRTYERPQTLIFISEHWELRGGGVQKPVLCLKFRIFRLDQHKISLTTITITRAGLASNPRHKNQQSSQLAAHQVC